MFFSTTNSKTKSHPAGIKRPSVKQVAYTTTNEAQQPPNSWLYSTARSTYQGHTSTSSLGAPSSLNRSGAGPSLPTSGRPAGSGPNGSESNLSAPRNGPQSRREAAASIRALQEQALAKLPEGGLFILLFYRNHPPQANDFHWGLYHHVSAGQGGNKYHIKNLNRGWLTDHGVTRGVLKSNFLCVLVQIANIPSSAVGQLDRIMRSKDHELNQTPGITCRVWLMLIVQKLIATGLVRCNSLEALQEDCMRFGNQYSLSASLNDQPRPVVQSRVCLL